MFCVAQRTICIGRPGRRLKALARAAMRHQQTNGNGNIQAPHQPRNVLGGPLQCCCTSPRTGYYRDGFCRTDASDVGRHVICAKVTREFLEFTASRGNDLSTPAPRYDFPGLQPGDKWCLCAVRWREALQEGKAPPVFLHCTHAKALEYVTLEELKRHALDWSADQQGGNNGHN
ncbi:hypothetical protein Agub_g15506 [Astrephomene gubernaculifera]|uniref:DUF2237 domain-containing protein n=1 Tax=Astrephomene gubernaculifera TaxID=47775 RepID=A0AAD3E360_9CHLO|nr:hypothetical protein Agub_g15506 [Astrephomene gubernaculifera]